MDARNKGWQKSNISSASTPVKTSIERDRNTYARSKFSFTFPSHSLITSLSRAVHQPSSGRIEPIRAQSTCLRLISSFHPDPPTITTPYHFAQLPISRFTISAVGIISKSKMSTGRPIVVQALG